MTITDVIDNEHKCVIEIELDEDFEKGFMEVNQIKKWSNPKFKDFFKKVLWRTLMSLEKGGYDTIYDKYTGRPVGSLKDVAVGDIISFWKESGGEHTRVIADVRRGIFVTEPLWETDKSLRVKHENVTRVVRKL